MGGGLYVRLAVAWGWVTGLRVSTRAQRYDQATVLAVAERRADMWERDASRANAQTREANRLLVLLSEPLKDWDLADFPSLSYSVTTRCSHAISPDDVQHLAKVLAAYDLTKGAVSHIRMGQKVGDRARLRGYDDADLHPKLRDLERRAHAQMVAERIARRGDMP